MSIGSSSIMLIMDYNVEVRKGESTARYGGLWCVSSSQKIANGNQGDHPAQALAWQPQMRRVDDVIGREALCFTEREPYRKVCSWILSARRGRYMIQSTSQFTYLVTPCTNCELLTTVADVFNYRYLLA